MLADVRELATVLPKRIAATQAGELDGNQRGDEGQPADGDEALGACRSSRNGPVVKDPE